MNVFDIWVLPLSKKDVTIVDSDTFHRVKNKKWCLQAKKYAGRQEGGRVNKRTVFLHRNIVEHRGENICGLIVDHIDGDPLNNTTGNLRVCDAHGSTRNRGPNRNNTTGFRGVVKRGRRYFAQIKVDYKLLSLGTFDTPEEASQAYKRAAKKHHGDFVRNN